VLESWREGELWFWKREEERGSRARGERERERERAWRELGGRESERRRQLGES